MFSAVSSWRHVVPLPMHWPTSIQEYAYLIERFGNVFSSSVLVAVTIWYAWTTRRIMKTNRELVAETSTLAQQTTSLALETKRMAEQTARVAETSKDTYLSSLAPEIEFDNDGISTHANGSVVNFKAYNFGKARVILK